MLCNVKTSDLVPLPGGACEDWRGSSPQHVCFNPYPRKAAMPDVGIHVLVKEEMLLSLSPKSWVRPFSTCIHCASPDLAQVRARCFGCL